MSVDDRYIKTPDANRHVTFESEYAKGVAAANKVFEEGRAAGEAEALSKKGLGGGSGPKIVINGDALSPSEVNFIATVLIDRVSLSLQHVPDGERDSVQIGFDILKWLFKGAK